MIQPEISVLIPIYNSSEFLYESITTVLNQTFENIELIIVDDGSTDNSLEILEDFAEKDYRLKIFSKENGGSATSRNMALKEASGKYISFFDPDDFISLNLLELAYESAMNNDSDMVIFKANAFYDDKVMIKNKTYFNLDDVFHLETYDDFTFNFKDIKDWVLNRDFAPWAKLYKKDFLDAYDDFNFDEGVSFEDVPFHVKAMLRARKISFVNEILYHWRSNNPNSVSNTPKFCYDIFKIIDIVYELLIEEGVYNEFELEFKIFEISQSFFYILVANSDDYYNMAKERVNKIELNFIEKMPKNIIDKYNMIKFSNNLEEFKINNSIYPYKINLERLNNQLTNLEKDKVRLESDLTNLEKDKVRLESDLTNLEKDKVRLESDLTKVKNDNKELKIKLDKSQELLDKSQKFNEEILSSNSWKITKPLRKIRNVRK